MCKDALSSLVQLQERAECVCLHARFLVPAYCTCALECLRVCLCVLRCGGGQGEKAPLFGPLNQELKTAQAMDADAADKEWHKAKKKAREE